MKKIIFVLGLSLLFSGWQTPSSTINAAELQTQVVPLNTRTLPRNGVRIPFLQINLTALEAPVEVKSLIIGRTGLSTSNDFGRIWAETSNYRRTNRRQLSNEDQVELAFRTPLVVSPGQNERLTVYANLDFAGGGRTASLYLIQLNHNATVKNPASDLENQTPARNTPTTEERQVPVFTKSKSRYDRTRFIIQCINQKCQLVPRS